MRRPIAAAANATVFMNRLEKYHDFVDQRGTRHRLADDADWKELKEAIEPLVKFVEEGHD